MKTLELARVFAVMIGAGALCAGCVAHAQVGATAESDPPVVFAEPPTLVAVDGGVWVVRDSDYATYYVDDDYWVFRDGVWYRSHTYDGHWVVAEVGIVPVVIVHRDSARYVHFRGEAGARTRRAPHEGERGHETATDAPRHDEGHGDGDHHEGHDHDDHADVDRHKEGEAKDVAPPPPGSEHKSDVAHPAQPARAGAGAPPPPKKPGKKRDKQ